MQSEVFQLQAETAALNVNCDAKIKSADERVRKLVAAAEVPSSPPPSSLHAKAMKDMMDTHSAAQAQISALDAQVASLSAQLQAEKDLNQDAATEHLGVVADMKSEISRLQAGAAALNVDRDTRIKSAAEKLAEVKAHLRQSEEQLRLAREASCPAILKEDLADARSLAEDLANQLEAALKVREDSNSQNALKEAKTEARGLREQLRTAESQAHTSLRQVTVLTEEALVLRLKYESTEASLLETDRLLSAVRADLVNSVNPLIPMLAEIMAMWKGERTQRQVMEGKIGSLERLSQTLSLTIDQQAQLLGATSSSSNAALAAMSRELCSITGSVAESHRLSLQESGNLQLRITSLHSELAHAKVASATSAAESAMTTIVAANMEGRLRESESACSLLATQLMGSSVHAAEMGVALNAQYSLLASVEHREQYLASVQSMGQQGRKHLADVNSSIMVATVKFVACASTIEDPEERKAEYVAYLAYARELIQGLPREDREHLERLALPILQASRISEIHGASMDVEEESYAPYVQALQDRSYVPLLTYPNGGSTTPGA